MDDGETRWRALLSGWPGAVLTIDARDRLTAIHRCPSRIDPQRDLARDLFDLVDADERPALRAVLTAARRGDPDPTWSTGLLSDRPGGRCDCRVAPLPDGGAILVSGPVVDNDRRFRALVESNHDAVALAEADGTTLYLSPGIEGLTGYAPADLAGCKPFPKVHPDDRPGADRALARIRATSSQPVTFEFRTEHRSGAWRWIEATGTNLLAVPAVGAVVLYFRDVTDRHEHTEAGRADDAHRAELRIRLLANLTQAFSEANRRPEVLLDAVVREVATALQCVCGLTLISDDDLHFTTPSLHASDPELLARFRDRLQGGPPRPIAAHPALARVVATHTPFFGPRLDPPERGDLQATSAMVVPLGVGGRVVGALGMSRHGDGAPAFDERDLALARSLAEHAALALAAARVVEDAVREAAERGRMAERLRLLAEASREFSEATGDYARLLPVIARRIGELIGDLCAVRAVSEDGATLERGAVHHRDPEIVAAAEELLAGLPQRVGEGATGRVAATGSPVLIPSISATTFAASTLPRFGPIIEKLAVQSVILVPMRSRGQVVGVTSVLRSAGKVPFTEDDLNLVQNIADHAALAITNARSYAAERRARAVAVEAEVAHRLLFEASPIPLVVFDRETLDLLAVNRAAAEQYGYPPDQMRSMSLADLRAEDAAALKSTVATLGDSEARGLARHYRRDGSSFLAEYVSRPFEFAGRRARIVVITDVTARQDADEMRALLAAVVRSSNDAIVSKRLDGTITSWNEGAERLFGYTAAEALGQPILLVVPEDRREEEHALMEQIAAGRRIEQFETVRRRKDQTRVPVAVSLAPIVDPSGRVIGASKTGRDLTEQHKAEEALRRTGDQLRQAQKMEAIGRLAGGVAHDFNNVLSVILSYSELLLEDVRPTDPARGDLEEIRNAALRASELTRQLLAFSRQQVVSPKILDLNEVIGETGKLLRPLLGEDIELVSVQGLDLGRVLADPTNVHQIVMNLAVNARDAMPTGGTLIIETANVELDADFAREHLGIAPGPHVMLAVSDTGTGMDAATQARIFEPFFTTKDVGRGTGLGLPTVLGIVQQSGGTVWVYSEPGSGTVFKVYLPRADQDLDQERAPATGTLGGTETILLVEDQDQVRAVARGILARSGYRVLVAENAGEALLLCEMYSGSIDLLLTDVVMPRMSGAELANRVCATRPEIRVLYMSGHTDDGVVRHGVLESRVAFLQKPFGPGALTRKVREVLDARPA